MIVMKQTIAYIISESNSGNTIASDLLAYYQQFNIEDKGDYIKLSKNDTNDIME
jgi:hypothetical protein